MGVCYSGPVMYCPHSLEAVSPSLSLLEEVLTDTDRPVWVNADILPGPKGKADPLPPQAFLSAVTALHTHTVLSLGWTTGWSAGTENPGEDASVQQAVFTLKFIY